MNLTWSYGFEHRQQQRAAGKSPKKSLEKDASLPKIDGPGSPSGTWGMASSASEPGLQSMRSVQASRVQAVVERQSEPTQIVQMRRTFSKAARLHTKYAKLSDEQEFLGALGAAGFKAFLYKKYGSLVIGWRALDKEKSGQLSFYEFCNACRREGHHGNMKKLWAELDVKCSGYISLVDIDAEVGGTVGKFKLALLNKYGDMLAAWQRGIDPQSQGRIQEQDMVDCVRRLGLEAEIDGGKLLKMLINRNFDCLTLAEFDPDAHARYVSGAVAAPSPKGHSAMSQDLHSDTGEAKPFVVGLQSVHDFQRALIQRYGSLLRAWREELDPDATGRLTSGDFFQAVTTRLGLHGNLERLWRLLLKANSTDLKKNTVVFADIDPETDALLTELREKLTATYGNMLLAWVKGFDSKGAGFCTHEEFVAVCKHANYSGDPAEMWRRMQPDAARAFLTLQDFDTKAFFAIHRGDYRMLCAGETDPFDGKKHHELSFMERQKLGFQVQLMKALQIANREEYAKACNIRKAKVNPLDEAESFENICKRTFGTMTNAWRQCFDLECSGKLSFNEFCKAVRGIGYAGDLKELWQKYGGHLKGYISLRELDPEADEILTSFLQLLAKQFGTVDDAWKLGFNKDPTESIDESTLCDACKRLGYPHSPKKLFKCLQPSAGKELLTIWELDPLTTRKRQRGESKHIAAPRSPAGAHGAPSPSAAAAAPGDLQPPTPAQRRSQAEQKVGASFLPVLRTSLKTMYGSTVAAWRCFMDPKQLGYISFGNFMIVMEDCAFNGNVKALWKVLCGDRGTATFRDIDPELQHLLETTRNSLLDLAASAEKFKDLESAPRDTRTLEYAWYLVDQAGLNRVSEEEWIAGTPPSMSDKTAKKLFNVMLARTGQRLVTKQDFISAMLIGVPPQDHEKVTGPPALLARPKRSRPAPLEGAAEPAAATPSPSPKAVASPKPSAGSPSARLLGSPKHGHDGPSPRSHAKVIADEWHSQDKAIASVEGFKTLLVAKYGSLAQAWRQLLDADNNGVMTQFDFANACRQLGIKAISKLWVELDPVGSGHVTLATFEPTTDAVFKELERLLSMQCKGLKPAWKKIFDPEKTLRTDLARFEVGCAKIGFTVVEPKEAFRLLLCSGRPFLFYEDVFTEIDRNDYYPEGRPARGGSISARSRSASPTIS